MVIGITGSTSSLLQRPAEVVLFCVRCFLFLFVYTPPPGSILQSVITYGKRREYSSFKLDLNWGLNHPIKRSKVFSHISKQKASIVYLQETHLIPKDINKLKRGGFHKVFHSKFTGKSRGTAILIHRYVAFEESKVIADKEGRYVIVQGKLFDQHVLLTNVYAPNWDNVNFFKDLFARIPDLDRHKLILAGDFNCTLHPLDRSKASSGPLSKSARCVNEFLQTYGLVDAWKYKNPTSRQYSFFSAAHQIYSRIDFIL